MYVYIYMHNYKRCDIFPKPSALGEGRLLPCSCDFERNKIYSKGRLDDTNRWRRKVRRPLLQDGLLKFLHHSFLITSWRRGRLTFPSQLFCSSNLPLLLFHFFRNRNCKEVVSPLSRPKVLGKYHTSCNYAYIYFFFFFNQILKKNIYTYVYVYIITKGVIIFQNLWPWGRGDYFLAVTISRNDLRWPWRSNSYYSL